MKISLKWLREYVDVPSDVKAFCDRLDMTGTGVEGADDTGAQFSGVYVGRIVEKMAHPNSDHMWITKVDCGAEQNTRVGGSEDPIQIVCGAQNFEAGAVVPVALPGAHLPVGDIKKSKLRGEVSMGMNCGPRDLGYEGDNYGLILLPEDAPIGADYAQYAGLADTVLDLEITPNRPDCLSVEGLAREVGAMYRVPVKDVLEGVKLAEEGPQTDTLATVEIEDAFRCPRYTARVIQGVKIGPSPAWLAQRVESCGTRSINNVVDVTNYVMFLLGQPLHAFDFDKIKSADGQAHIIVRAAAEGERLTTLDGQDRALTPDMTLITTPEGAVALAGVMGGQTSEVTEDTVNILLEAATFDSGHTSRTSRNLGLFSEASMRYERKVDAQRVARNADFAAALMAQICGGTVSAGLVDCWPEPAQMAPLTYRHDRCAAMMGAPISAEEAIDILERLGCVVEGDGPTYTVTPPSFRPDLEREIDLYEEVLRLYGMENVPPMLPGTRGRIGVRTWAETVQAKLHFTLRASGVNETQTYAFAAPDDVEKLRLAPVAEGENVELINPLNAEMSVLRQSLIPGLLRSVAYNQNHGVANIQLYEVGNVFSTAEGRKLPKERTKVAGVLAGAMAEDSWNATHEPFDFFDAKGVVENIMRELAVAKVRYKALTAEEAPHLQPGRAAAVWAGGAQLGWVGEIHPLAVAAFDAQTPVAAFELDMRALAKAARPQRDTHEVPQFPPVTMDVAFVVPEDVTAERLMQCMQSAGGKLLASARLFDVYRDQARLGAGKKSLAFALEWRAADRTLTAEEADAAHARLVKKVCAATGAQVRG